ncbi:hypothetical protein AC1031_000262 [Aphanomyces cochlioides]|nr:hypothetical protein AC1031_000262 [Aphanomyces cochlioides]
MTSWIDTPAVVVDEARLQRNIELMQERATKHQVNLRPHAKTHKSVDIANRVLAAGAVGLTVSKPLEARKFMEAGFKDITLAYPVVVPQKLDLTLECALAYQVTFNLTVDSVYGAKVAAESAAKLDHVLNVLIHIDVGYHRVGLEENDPRLRELVQFIQQSPSLKLIGILSHAGHSYGAKSREECIEIAETERLIMLRVKATIEALGSPISVVSLGSTPTELCRENYEGITEVRLSWTSPSNRLAKVASWQLYFPRPNSSSHGCIHRPKRIAHRCCDGRELQRQALCHRRWIQSLVV